LGGCQAPWISKKAETPAVAQPDDLEPELEFVGDLTNAWGLGYLKVEGIALITRLPGTGSDPPPNDRRESLRNEMKLNGVAHPDEILALDSTAMAFVSAYYPPGARKGDRCDVIVNSPPGSATRSLDRGWLIQTRLRPVEVLGNRLRQGKLLGMADGPVLVNAVFQGEDDKVNSLRGRVLGGGVCLVDRPIGLVVTAENHSIMTTTHVAAAINRRFYAMENGRKLGAAEPKDNDYVELRVNPKYRHNLQRYLQVVRAIAVHESPQHRIDRLNRLEPILLDPISSARAAIRLEAIGREAIPVLTKGLGSSDAEVRFRSAEALAYLEEGPTLSGPTSEAAAVLLDTAQNSRAFRWHALAALTVVEHGSANEALTQLLHAPGAELRCGALRAMQTRSPNDPLVRGEMLGDPALEYPTVKLVVISSTQAPLVHFLRYREPQIAIFGNDLRLQTPFSLFAGKEIIVKSIAEDRVNITRFTPGEDERRLECSTRLDDIVRNIVQIGGGYADAMQAIREAQQTGALAARIEVNALPTADRKEERDEPSLDSEDAGMSSSESLPALFFDRQENAPSREVDEYVAPDEDEETPTWWERVKGWVSG
jgi:flagellar basal body P-ring protein FlgI